MHNATATVYRFLSFLYQDEIPLAFLEEMQANPFFDQLNKAAANCASPGLRSGLAKITATLQGGSAQDIYNELRYEYAGLFLNAGKNPVFPYASCHLSEEPLLMQEPVFAVRQAYSNNGVHKNPAYPDLDDHIAVELEFMAYLAEQQGTEEKQRAFLSQHLGWADAFCEMLRSAAQTEWYQGLADLTQTVLEAAVQSALEKTDLEQFSQPLSLLILDTQPQTLSPGAIPQQADNTIKTHCYICAGLCGQEVKLRDQVITGLSGLAGDPKGGGRLCIKGANAHKNTYSAYRLKTPLIRENGRLRKASWDEALDLTASRLKSLDPKTVGFHQGNDFNSWCHDAVMAAYGTPNKTTHRQMCDNPNRMANEHCGNDKRPWIDYAHSEFILLFGINELVTSVGQRKLNLLKQAIKRGTKLVTVDPRRSETAEVSTEWISILPGTDGALALAMAYVLVTENLYDQAFVKEWCYGFAAFKRRLQGEEDGILRTPFWAEGISGVPAATIERLAREFAAAAPAAAALSWTGVAQVPNAVHATQAIQALNALVGSFDAPGGPSLIGKRKLASPWGDGQPKPPNNAEKFKLNRSKLWKGWIPAYLEEDVQAGRLKAMLCYFGNPVMSDGSEPSTQRAMRQLEFTCAIDCFMSNTTELCDVILPDCTYLEQSRVISDWMYESFISLGRKAIAPLYDSRSVVAIFTGLAERLGYGEYFPWKSEEEYMTNQLHGQGVSLNILYETGYFVTDAQKFYKHREWGSFNPPAGYGSSGTTLTGKYNFINPAAKKIGGNALPDYIAPYADWPELQPDHKYPMIIGYFRIAEHEHCSTFWNPALVKKCGSNPVWMNYQDAKQLDISDGDEVLISSPWGEATATAKVTWGIRQGVLAAGGGFGGKYGLEGDPKYPECGGFNTNVLLPPNLACTWSGTPPLKYIKTRIEKI
ncbi:MAG: molybdopterin-dependent oxidoreductase [Candidatus Electrothrix sp. GW3-4]|uniref:molybdopterin-dependent oxidoreductase n=1 Tax=Candidatus Electrothrix sp. GW3-4 TaxID=3126740 RepID=UPI0030CF3818